IFLAIFKQRALMRDLTAKKDELSEEIHLLEEDIENLENNIANSNSVEFIEKTARDELGMVKPREIIYVDKNKNKTKK
ncbi:MAG TPA: septum formation initiator family protein, partial [Tissierellaceae bacterium]